MQINSITFDFLCVLWYNFPMRKLLKYLRHYKLESILAPFFKLLEAAFELIVPLIVASIVDDGVNGGRGAGYVVGMCLVLVGLGVVGLISSVTAQYFAAKSAVGFSKELRSDLFAKMQSLSYSQIDGIGTSRMITRMTSDVNQIQSGVNMVLRLFMRSPFIVFGAMILAFTISVAAGTVFAITIAVLCVVVFGIMLITIPLYKKSQANLDRLTASTRQTLVGVRVLRAFCKEEEEIKTFNERNGALCASQKFAGLISALMNPLTYAIINVGTIILLNTGAIEVNSGALSQGDVIALYNYMAQILVELIKLANLIITVTKSFACAGRVNEVFAMPCEISQPKESVAAAGGHYIEFRDVCARYTNGANALTDISFTAEKGQTIGVIGGTGAGKSTLVNLIPHFYSASEGSVSVGGMNVNDAGDEKMRSLCGVVPQRAVLFRGTIRENMQWGNQGATDEEIIKAIDCACASDVVSSKDGGLDAYVEQGGKNFSGGQRQRLTIARALVKRPEILILDDSASALDYATDARLRANLRTLDYNPTVFIVSQRTSSIRNADKILVLDNGHLVGLGTHEQLLESCELYREIHYSQYQKEGA